MARIDALTYLPGMERADHIAELERRISENTTWRAAWANGLGTRDQTAFHRRGKELAIDRQELELLKRSDF